ncbi:MAG TPA: type II toxin-antitoxin system RelE/ParE family toxin [Chthoniobacteraceae bacterium]|jgi:toxin ParE1/3/4
MAVQIVWTEPALNDLREIVEFLSFRDVAAAERIGRGLIDQVELLVEHPRAGSFVGGECAIDLRKVVFRNWLIVYRHLAEENRVIIIRIWHGARGPVDLQESSR